MEAEIYGNVTASYGGGVALWHNPESSGPPPKFEKRYGSDMYHSDIYGDGAGEENANRAALGGNAPAVVVGDATQKRLTLYRDGTIGRTERFILTGDMTAHPRMTAVP